MSNYDDDQNRIIGGLYEDDEDDSIPRPIMDEFGNLLDEDETLVVEEVIEWAHEDDDLPPLPGIIGSLGDDDDIPLDSDKISVEDVAEDTE